MGLLEAGRGQALSEGAGLASPGSRWDRSRAPTEQSARPRAAGRGAWRAAIPATPPWTWARAGRPWGGFGWNTRPGVGGRRGGGSQQGVPQKADSLPAQPHLVFPSAETEQDKGGEGGPCRGARPLLTKAAASSAGRTREEGLGGRADTPGAPLQQRPTPPSSQRGCREDQTLGRWTRTPRRPKDSPFRPRKAALRERERAQRRGRPLAPPWN